VGDTLLVWISLGPSTRLFIDALVKKANDILQGRVAPIEGAASLAAFVMSLGGLTEALLVFTSLDSDGDEHRGIDPQWDSRPERRADIQHDIVVAADRFGK
jgi:hypothetical protein